MELAWATDLHLDSVDASTRQQFVDEISATKADALLIAGDTATANSVFAELASLQASADLPLYFVLGNHDFYGSSIPSMREAAQQQASGCQWLGASGVVALSEHTALIGHDGWGDGRLGDLFATPIHLNDQRLIEGLIGLERPLLAKRLAALGDESATYLEAVLRSACREFSEIVCLTHVPPFQAACWWAGQASNDPNWLPYFVCAAVGERLAAVMAQYPDRQLTVLCGHTHQAADVQIAANIRVIVGGAEYGKPVLQPPLTLA